MRGKQAFRLGAIRMIKAALKNREVEKGAALSEDEERAVLQTLIKQRRESAEHFRRGARPDLAEKEDAEAVLIQQYLPPAATDDEVRNAVDAAIAETNATSIRDMGRVMKVALGLLASRTVDGARVSAQVREKLESQ